MGTWWFQVQQKSSAARRGNLLRHLFTSRTMFQFMLVALAIYFPVSSVFATIRSTLQLLIFLSVDNLLIHSSLNVMTCEDLYFLIVICYLTFYPYCPTFI